MWKHHRTLQLTIKSRQMGSGRDHSFPAGKPEAVVSGEVDWLWWRSQLVSSLRFQGLVLCVTVPFNMKSAGRLSHKFSIRKERTEASLSAMSYLICVKGLSEAQWMLYTKQAKVIKHSTWHSGVRVPWDCDTENWDLLSSKAKGAGTVLVVAWMTPRDRRRIVPGWPPRQWLPSF